MGIYYGTFSFPQKGVPTTDNMTVEAKLMPYGHKGTSSSSSGIDNDTNTNTNTNTNITTHCTQMYPILSYYFPRHHS